LRVEINEPHFQPGARGDGRYRTSERALANAALLTDQSDHDRHVSSHH
jgi:hypothetical protein